METIRKYLGIIIGLPIFKKKLPCRRVHNTKLPSLAFHRLKDLLIPRSRKDKRTSQEKVTGSVL